MGFLPEWEQESWAFGQHSCSSPRDSLKGRVWQWFFLQIWHYKHPHPFRKSAHPGKALHAFLTLFLQDPCLTLLLLLETKLCTCLCSLQDKRQCFLSTRTQITTFHSIGLCALELNALHSADGVNSKNVEGNRAGEIACDYYLRAGWSSYWRGSSWELALQNREADITELLSLLNALVFSELSNFPGGVAAMWPANPGETDPSF